MPSKNGETREEGNSGLKDVLACLMPSTNYFGFLLSICRVPPFAKRSQTNAMCFFNLLISFGTC